MKTKTAARSRISVPIGDWRLEGYAHGFKFGRMRPVEIEGKRTFVLGEPVRYYPSLASSLKALHRLATQGEIQNVGPSEVSTLQELAVLVGAASSLAETTGAKLDAKLDALK